MKVLVIGRGAREHAIVWKLSQSKHINKIYCSPGNAGIAEFAECINVSPDNFGALVDFVKYEWIDLTIVCSEEFLARDLVNTFEREGCRILGSHRTATELMVSRVFAKNLMRLHGIPTAEYRVFTSYLHAQDHIRLKGAPIVIKTDGHAEGDGVFVASTTEKATDALKLIMKDRIFGDAGRQVIIEENLKGQRVSFVALTDGRTVLPLTSLYIYRSDEIRANAMGMGAYCPVPLIEKELETYIMDKIMGPLLRVFGSEGIKYKGFISADLIVNRNRAHVFELNFCFGDLEAQTLLPRLKTDFTEMVLAVTGERLSDIEIAWGQNASVCVVGSSKVYSERSPEGVTITGLEKIKTEKDTFAFHENTLFHNSDVVAAGERVICITATGEDLKDAKTKAYGAIGKINFDGMYYRKDIGNGVK